MNKITILVFSTRSSGNCSRIAEFLEDYYKRTNVCTYFVDLQPCGGCDYECLRTEAVCPKRNDRQEQIMDAVCESDLVYMIVPNFCGYPCSSYFAFNERSVGYFNMDRSLLKRYLSVRKRFIVVSNTQGNPFRDALQQQTNSEPEIFYFMSGKYGKRSIDGDILDSNEAAAALNEFLEQLK